jgi:S-methylmethionine-dependent homocysteine/selenocysteine methylase
MSAVEALLARRDARPILLGGDPLASLRALEVDLASTDERGALGRLLRDAPAMVSELHARELAAGVDVLTALTEGTTAPALGRVGMAFRAAALTRAAVELADGARKTAPRSVVLAGVLALPRSLGEARRDEELQLHAARLATAGCELILVRSGGSALAHARATKLPTWLVVEVDASGRPLGREPLGALAQRAHDDGASALLIDASSVDAARTALDVALKACLPIGVLLRASSTAGVAGAVDAWVAEALGLVDHGAKILGGGAGTTTDAIALLAETLAGSWSERTQTSS